MADEKMVTYKGIATVRSISKKEWEAVKVQGQEGVEWNAQNGYAVKFSALNKDAIEQLKKEPKGEFEGLQ